METENKGWIKLHRCLLKKAAWQLCTEGQKVVLITVLLLANHEPKKWLWKGQLYECQAGQFVTSYQNLARACNISTKTVRGALEKLEKLEFVTCERAHTGTLITVENWALYQGTDENGAHHRAQEGQREGTEGAQQGHVNGQLTRNKELKEVKNKRNIYGEFKHVRLTEDEHERLIKDYGEEVTNEAIKAVDEYCESSGKRYKNYSLAIRNWGVREGKERIERGVPERAGNATEHDYQEWDARIREITGGSFKNSEDDVFK